MKRTDFIKRIFGAAIVVPVLPSIIEKATQPELKLFDLLKGAPDINGSWLDKQCIMDGSWGNGVYRGSMDMHRSHQEPFMQFEYNDNKNVDAAKLWNECWEKMINEKR